MCTRRITFIAVIAMFIIATAAVVIGADLPQASLSPDRILKGTTQTITITLDKSIPNQEQIKRVHVRGQDVTVHPPGADGKLSVPLPKLDIVGPADVEVIGKDDKTVAVGQLTYVDSAEPSSNGLWLLLLYVFLIALPPSIWTVYDIHQSYEERSTVLKQLPKDAKIDEIKDLLEVMDKGPSGLTGLTRGIVAVTLILVLAIAVFHLVVFTPKVPPIAEQLLTLLAGTLTAITGFYFGSKSATEKATTPPKPATGETGGSVVPKILNFEPPKVVTGQVLKVNGEEFGEQKGTVKFRGKDAKGQDIDKEGTVIKWNKKQIEVTVPPELATGQQVKVVVTNDNGKSSDPKQVEIIQ